MNYIIRTTLLQQINDNTKLFIKTQLDYGFKFTVTYKKKINILNFPQSNILTESEFIESIKTIYDIEQIFILAKNNNIEITPTIITCINYKTFNNTKYNSIYECIRDQFKLLNIAIPLSSFKTSVIKSLAALLPMSIAANFNMLKV